jgi:hypothetical protein
MVEPLPLLLMPLGLLLTLRVLPLVILPSCYKISLSQQLLAAEAPTLPSTAALHNNTAEAPCAREVRM